MPNIQNLADLIRQRAFLEAGGGRRDPAESISEIFGNAGKGMVNFADARNKNLESILLGEKEAREGKKSKLEMEKLSQETAPYRNPVTLGQEIPLSLYQKKTLADIKETEAKSKYYEGGQVGGNKLYVNPTTREISDVPKPGFYQVSSNTGVTVAAGPTKEAEAERMRVNAEERKPPTDTQSTSAIYATRMQEAEKILEPMTSYASNANALAFQAQRVAPDVANPLKSSEFQQYDQAARNFLNAVLRRESGAVISPTEFQEGRRQYFPMPGDHPEVLEQKRMNRQSAIQGISGAAGKALNLNQPINKVFPPRVGERKGNYRFKGGNPADQKNWVPVKK